MDHLPYRKYTYYIQLYGANRELVESCRKILDKNGATSCRDPTLEHCNLILVDTPSRSKRYNFLAPGTAMGFGHHRQTGEWTFDALCHHFARRSGEYTDNLPEQRKNVVGAGWVLECDKHQRVLNGHRFNSWEIVAQDPGLMRRHKVQPQVVQQAPAVQAQPEIEEAEQSFNDRSPIEHSIPEPLAEFTSTSTLPKSDLIRADVQAPPSPPPTSISSFSRAGSSGHQVFDSVTQDELGSRTFFVACQSKGAVEFYIKANGGMLDELVEATFIIVDAPADGVISSRTREILGQLRRSQKAVHPGWIEECVRQNAIAHFEQYIVRIPREDYAISRQAEARSTSGQQTVPAVVPDTARAPLVDTTISKGKRRQSQMDLDQSIDTVHPNRSEMPFTPSSIAPRAVDPRVRPRLSSEVTATPPPVYSVRQNVPPTVVERPAIPAQPRKPNTPSTSTRPVISRQVSSEMMNTDNNVRPAPSVPTVEVKSVPRPSISRPLTPPLPRQTPQEMVPAVKSKDEPRLTAASPVPTTPASSQPAKKPVLVAAAKRTASSPLVKIARESMRPSSPIAPSKAAIALRYATNKPSGSSSIPLPPRVVKSEVKVEVPDVQMEAVAPIEVQDLSPSPQISSPVTLPQNSMDDQIGDSIAQRQRSLSATSSPAGSRQGSPRPTLSPSLEPEYFRTPSPEPMTHNFEPPTAATTSDASAKSQPRADVGDDGNESDTKSTTSSEVSATTCPSEAESSPPPALLGGSASQAGPATSSEPLGSSLSVSAAPTVPQPTTSHRLAASLISDAKTDVLVTELDQWLNSNPTQALTRFLRDLRGQRPGFDWLALYHRKRGIVRSRLLALNHQATKLDKLHIVGVGSRPKNAKSTTAGEPYFVTGGTVGLDSIGRSHPLIAASRAKLDELVIEFDHWLKNGSHSRNEFLRELENVKKPGYGWLRAYLRWRGTIWKRLLAMGHLPVDLDRAGLFDGPDEVHVPRPRAAVI